MQASQDLPYIPLGQYFTDSAYQKDLTGIRRGIPLPLNVRRGNISHGSAPVAQLVARARAALSLSRAPPPP